MPKHIRRMLQCRRSTWLTGTAAWNYVAISQWIMGIRPHYDGLQVAPVIPTTWKGFSATRTFRDIVYQIQVERTGQGNDISLTVEGEQISGSIIPIPPAEQKEVHVLVKVS
jgi:cellobiose phosphorylase